VLIRRGERATQTQVATPVTPDVRSFEECA